ncbi:MAG: response regulator [Pseudomonadales bacterium]|nr:response regulator [Pseudomonadales bacterium]
MNSEIYSASVSNLMPKKPLVYIVDDNLEQAEVTTKLLAREGFDTVIYESGERFLELPNFSDQSCVLLDNHMPGGMSGLDVQEELARRDAHIPIVFMSGDSEFRHVVKAMKSGAHEFLQKPFSSSELYQSINAAIEENKVVSQEVERQKERDDRIGALTAREKQVLELLSLGFTNKMISKELSIVVSTVEFHRANLMSKLHAKSLADLIAIYRGGAQAS